MNLAASEKIINTWKISYETQEGEKYEGRLIVTSARLLYDAGSAPPSRDSGNQDLFTKWGSDEFFMIPKERIAKVEISRSLLSKKVIVTLDNESRHTFNYGILDVRPVAD